MRVVLWPIIQSIMMYVSHALEKKCVLCCCWVNCSINVEILWVDDVIKFFYILADFLSVLSIVERSVESSKYTFFISFFFKYTFEYIYFSFQF